MGTLSVREALVLAMDKLKVTATALQTVNEGWASDNIDDAIALIEEALKEIDDDEAHV